MYFCVFVCVCACVGVCVCGLSLKYYKRAIRESIDVTKQNLSNHHNRLRLQRLIFLSHHYHKATRIPTHTPAMMTLLTCYFLCIQRIKMGIKMFLTFYFENVALLHTPPYKCLNLKDGLPFLQQRQGFQCHREVPEGHQLREVQTDPWDQEGQVDP